MGPSAQVIGVGHVVQNQDSLVVRTSDTPEWRASWTAVREQTFSGQIFI